MDLILILGPMKSGKSYELINYFSPLKYTKENFALYQPVRNIRDEHISSRNGVNIKAIKVHTIESALKENFSVIGIDEVHMFDEKEAGIIDRLLRAGTKVIASGLDTDYRGKMFKIIKKLLELGPKEVRYKRAVCEVCMDHSAIYSQVLDDDIPITEGLPPSIPDDGTFKYKPVCRHCFVKKNNNFQ